MAKRFIDTDIWKKKFVKGLTSDQKLFWIYLMTECNHAGIWEVEIEIANLRLGLHLEIETLREVFKEKVIELDVGSKWFLPSFVFFQCGGVPNSNIRAQKSILDILASNDISIEFLKKIENKESINCLQTVKDKDIDKDIDKDKEIPGAEKFLKMRKRT